MAVTFPVSGLKQQDVFFGKAMLVAHSADQQANGCGASRSRKRLHPDFKRAFRLLEAGPAVQALTLAEELFRSEENMGPAEEFAHFSGRCAEALDFGVGVVERQGGAAGCR